MSRLRITTIVASIAIILPLLGVLFVQSVGAISVQTTGTAVAQGETLNDTLFATGQSMTVAGNVNGDVFCAGQTVTISGDVKGDIICAAQTINITGNITGDLRLAAQTIIIDGKVTGSTSLAAQTVTLTGAGLVGTDMGVAASDITLNGKVGRHAMLTGATVALNGPIGGNVDMTVDSISLGGGATIAGNLNYASPEDALSGNSSQVAGAVNWTELKQDDINREAEYASVWFASIYLPLAMFFFAILLVLIFPNKFQQASSFAVNDWGKTLLVGFVASMIVPIVISVLFVTIIGIPAAMILGLVWLLVLILAGPFAAYLLGRVMLHTKIKNSVIYMMVGSIILIVLYIIPVVNFLAWLAVSWFGIGMMLRNVGFEKPVYTVNEGAKVHHKEGSKVNKTK